MLLPNKLFLLSINVFHSRNFSPKKINYLRHEKLSTVVRGEGEKKKG